MRFGFAKKTGISAFLSAMLVLAPHVWAETFTAKVVGVSDGDTVKVLTEQSCDTGKDCRSGKIQYRVRLAEIDTPEKKQPYGSKAKQALSDLVFGRMIKVEQIDKDRYGRLVANLYVDGKWVNAEMVRSGSAWVYRQYAKTPELFKWRPRPKPISEVSGHYRNRRELPLGSGEESTNHTPEYAGVNSNQENKQE